MSSRLPDERVEPVGLLVDRLEELAASSSGVHATSRWSRLVTDALIDASGVRRSCDTAASSAVRSSLRLGQAGSRPRRRRAAGAARPRPAAALANDAQHLEVVVGRASAPTTTSCSSSPIGTEKRAVLGPAGTGSPAAASTSQPSSVLRASTATASAANAARSCATSCGSGSSVGDEGPAERGERLGLGAARRAASAVRRLAMLTSQLTTPATTRKTTSARRFSPSAIVNVWNGGVK